MTLVSRKLLTALFPLSAIVALSLLVAPASAGQVGGGGGDHGSYLYDKYLEEEAARERQAEAAAPQLRSDQKLLSGQSVVVGISEFDGGTPTAAAKARRLRHREGSEQLQYDRGR